MSDAKEPPANLVIELDEPIEHQGAQVTELRLREPKAFEVVRAETELKGGMTPDSLRRYQISLVCLVSGVDRKFIEKLPIRKLNEASAYVQGFIEAGPQIGES